MEREEILEILSQFVDKAFQTGIVNNREYAKVITYAYDRFTNLSYNNQDEYLTDIEHLKQAAEDVQSHGFFTLEEAYLVYFALATAQNLELVFDNQTTINIEPEKQDVVENGVISASEIFGIPDETPKKKSKKKS